MDGIWRGWGLLNGLELAMLHFAVLCCAVCSRADITKKEGL